MRNAKLCRRRYMLVTYATEAYINPYIRRRRYMLVPTHLAKYIVRHILHQNSSKFVYILH